MGRERPHLFTPAPDQRFLPEPFALSFPCLTGGFALGLLLSSANDRAVTKQQQQAGRERPGVTGLAAGHTATQWLLKQACRRREAGAPASCHSLPESWSRTGTGYVWGRGSARAPAVGAVTDQEASQGSRKTGGIFISLQRDVKAGSHIETT